LLNKFSDHTVVIVNPDNKDLDKTKTIMFACGFSKRCNFYNHTISDLQFSSCSFDTITSISVLEHIPMDRDLESIKCVWNLLKIGGRLLLSVPCARESFEEFIDLNEYGLLVPDKDNYVFGQRFYDESLLTDRIFNITGRPMHYSIYGEKMPGIFLADREEKISGREYPFWKEPYLMGRNYMLYNSINDLPGLGVIAMEFVKS
jgi:SAM-dependent methyltransferase